MQQLVLVNNSELIMATPHFISMPKSHLLFRKYKVATLTLKLYGSDSHISPDKESISLMLFAETRGFEPPKPFRG